MNLQSILDALTQSGTSDKISQKTGVSSDQIGQIIAMGLPMIIGGLAHNTKTSEGSQSLDDALAKDHTDSPVLSNPDAAAADEKATEGNKILDHIFGTNKSTIGDAVSEKTGLDASMIMKVLAFAAPFVLAYLAKQKQDNNMTADDMATTLGQQQTSDGVSLSDIVTQVIGMFTTKAQ